MRSRFPFILVLATLVLACASFAQAQTWTAVGPPGNPVVQAFLPDPGAPATIFAGTADSGVLVSTDSGSNWNAANNGLTSLSVTALAGYQPSSPPGTPPVQPFLYAGTSDGGVFVSSSRGASWTASNTGLTNLAVSGLVVGASGSPLYAATQGGVFKSTDGGAHWAAMNSGLTNTFIRAIAIDPSNPSTLYAGTDFLIFKTVNGGAAWTTVFSGPGQRVQGIAIDPVTSSTVYAVGPFFPNPELSTRVLKSTDGGTTWSDSANGLLQGGGATVAILVDPAAAARLYVAKDSAVFVSKNFGASWSLFNSGLPAVATALTLAQTSPPTVFVGTAGSGAYRGISDSVGVCAVGATNLCLQANRFRVEVAWSVPAESRSGSGQAIPLSADTGTFWFFDSANYELMIKVLDGRAINGHIWVFYGALSNVEYTITVTDTQTGAIKNYTNAFGTLASVADTSAF